MEGVVFDEQRILIRIQGQFVCKRVFSLAQVSVCVAIDRQTDIVSMLNENKDVGSFLHANPEDSSAQSK